MNRAIEKFYESIPPELRPETDVEFDLARIRLIGYGLFTGSLSLQG